MNELVIVFAIIFVIIAAFAIVLIRQDEKRSRNLTNLFLSYDKPKQIRISMLKNDLIANNESMGERKALELAIELEEMGWRKEVQID